MTPQIGERFTALQNFYSEEYQCHYEKGLGYTVQSEALAKIVERWVSEGKVELGGAAARMTGTGG